MSDITENISENENANNVKENDVEEKIDVENIKPEPVAEVKTKRKYVKRKKVENVIETNLDPPIKPEIIEVPEPKNTNNTNENKVKINREEVEAIEEAGEESFFKGGLIKPLLIAGLASASFGVNNVYFTKRKVEEEENFQQFKKKKCRKRHSCCHVKLQLSVSINFLK